MGVVPVQTGGPASCEPEPELEPDPLPELDPLPDPELEPFPEPVLEPEPELEPELEPVPELDPESELPPLPELEPEPLPVSGLWPASVGLDELSVELASLELVPASGWALRPTSCAGSTASGGPESSSAMEKVGTPHAVRVKRVNKLRMWVFMVY